MLWLPDFCFPNYVKKIVIENQNSPLKTGLLHVFYDAEETGITEKEQILNLFTDTPNNIEKQNNFISNQR